MEIRYRILSSPQNPGFWIMEISTDTQSYHPFGTVIQRGNYFCWEHRIRGDEEPRLQGAAKSLEEAVHALLHPEEQPKFPRWVN